MSSNTRGVGADIPVEFSAPGSGQRASCCRTRCEVKQGPPRPSRIAGQCQQAGGLRRPGEHGSHDAQQTDGSVRIQRQERGRGQIAFGGVADRAYDGKWQVVSAGRLGHRAAFQINRVGAGGDPKRSLRRCSGNDGRTRQDRVAGEPAEARGKRGVRLPGFAFRQHIAGDDQRPWAQRRIEPPGEAEADQRGRPLPDQLRCRGDGARRGAATGLDQTAEAGSDAGLGGQADDETDGQNPTSTRRVLPRTRLRYRASASSGKYSL